MKELNEAKVSAFKNYIKGHMNICKMFIEQDISADFYSGKLEAYDLILKDIEALQNLD